MEQLRIGDIEAAINAARLREPAQGSDSTLSADVAVLAGLYGEMIWLRRTQIAVAELSETQRTVLERWQQR